MAKTTLRSGRWTEEEHEQFLQTLKKHGKDYTQLEKDIPTRTLHQIRTHYNHYVAKNLDGRDLSDVLKSPEVTRKRKTHSDEEDESPSKKPKSASSTAAPKEAASKKKASAKATSSKAKVKNVTGGKSSSKPITPPKSSSKGEDLIPPKGTVSKAVKKETKKPLKPVKADPIVNDAAVIAAEDTTEVSTISQIIEFLRREEIQTVAAGIAGFLIVFAVKKFVTVN